MSVDWMEKKEMEEFWQEYSESMMAEQDAAVKHACIDEKTGKVDYVNSPAHYNTGRVEVIEAIEDWGLGFHEGNVVKYVARAAHKGNRLQDLEKAAWYLARLIEGLKK